MPLRQDLRKVMVLGSGPIVIGQAAEFDYAGTQACRSLQEEGLEVVLVNSNPATIMTDTNIADHVYIEPLTVESVAAILRRERPDGLLPTLGGQVGLNLAVELAEQGILQELGVSLLGTPLSAVKQAEDRELFKSLMAEIGEPVPESRVVTSFAEAKEFADAIGFPLIIRPAYTLGGTGGGIAASDAEFTDIVTRGLKASRIHQVLVERSVAGWKEIEFEVMRDAKDTCLTICSMENVDPIGVHTGDSIVVAPCQTLTAPEYKMLSSASLKIIQALGIAGGCNVQFALDPHSWQYYVIEVNPRVSRSSALASKATGYPIARVTSKIAIGFSLDEIVNPVTGETTACFEPTIDYVVAKVPRWPFDKFATANRTLGTQMKSTGEVMAIDRTMEGALLKSIRSLETGVEGLLLPELAELSGEELTGRLRQADDERLFLLGEALRRGMEPAELRAITGIDEFFIRKIGNIIRLEQEISAGEELQPETLRQAKQYGFSDAYLGRLLGQDALTVRAKRQDLSINPVYKMVDTCAAEFDAVTPYYYSCYDAEDEVKFPAKPKALVIGSGPIRIGQGIEFDYCSVHAVWALRECGREAVIINNNPETVSTDFNTSDRLYFEPLQLEDVLNIIDKEQPEGVIVQFGGQTAINLAAPLAAAGVKILGTSSEDIDVAEDRERFDALLTELSMRRPPGKAVNSLLAAKVVADLVGYPVMVRPSYVLGGRAMQIVHNDAELEEYVRTAVRITPQHPVLVDKYLNGKEIEVDAIADGETVLIPGIMEHVERAGVHSGDSTAVYPPQTLSPRIKEQIVTATTKLALALRCRGVLNIQFVLYRDELYVLEVNPRASRTVPILSKVTGIPMVNVATRVCLGQSLAAQGYAGGLWPERPFAAVKMPVFSWSKLSRVDTSLGPEMKSTGEVMGLGRDYAVALYQAFMAAGFSVPTGGSVLVTVADKDKEEAAPIIREFANLGFRIFATEGTAKALSAAGISVERVNKIREGSPQIIDLIQRGTLDLVINTLTRGKDPERDGFRIRRAAVEYAIPCLTSLDTAGAILTALVGRKNREAWGVRDLQGYLKEEAGND